MTEQVSKQLLGNRLFFLRGLSLLEPRLKGAVQNQKRGSENDFSESKLEELERERNSISTMNKVCSSTLPLMLSCSDILDGDRY